MNRRAWPTGKNMSEIYRTIQRDAFDAIAYRKFQDEHLCNELMAANVDYMDVLFFAPGAEIEIPDLTPPRKIASLPPWYEK